MAAQQAITMEPAITTVHKNPGFQPQKYDSNGEEIVFEAECHKSGVCFDVFRVYFYPSVMSLLGILLLIPIGIICSLKAPKDWKLYLTRSSMVYHRPNGCCCKQHYTVPFDLIQDIYTVRGTKNIWVKMEPADLYKYIGWCNRPLCGDINFLVLSNVANGKDFVAALKREMGR